MGSHQSPSWHFTRERLEDMFPGHPGDYETNAGTRYMPRGKATHSVDRPGTGSEAAWADATPGSAQPGPPAIQPCRKGLWSRWGLEQPRNHPHLHGHRPVFLHSPGQWSLALGRAVPILSAPAAPQQKSPQQWGALLICAEPQRPAHTPPAPVSRCWSQVRAPAAPAPFYPAVPAPSPLHSGPNGLLSEEVPAGRGLSDTQTGLHERTQDGSGPASPK